MKNIYLTAIFAIFAGLAIMPAQATPGMVDRSGCHGHPKHCHGSGELRTNSSGRHYVAGAFSHSGHGHKGRKARRRHK
jgi:hypothetical protein